MNTPQNDPFAADLEDFSSSAAPQQEPNQYGFQPQFQPTQQQPDPNGQQGTPPTEPMIPWSQAMELIRQPMVAPVQQVAPPQPTPEQIAQHMRQFQPDDAFAEAFIAALERGEDGKRNPAAIKKTIAAMVEAQRVEMLRALELHNEARDQRFIERTAPLQKFVDDQRAQQVWGEFSGMFPGLAHLKDFVDMTASRVDPRRLPPGTTKQQFYTYVANSVAQEMGRMGIQLDLSPTAQPQQSPQQQPAANQFQRPAPHVPAMQQMTHGSVPRGGPQGASNNKNPYFDAESFRS